MHELNPYFPVFFFFIFELSLDCQSGQQNISHSQDGYWTDKSQNDAAIVWLQKKRIRGDKQDLKIHPSHSECSDNEFRNQPQKQNPTCWSLPAVSVGTSSLFIGFWQPTLSTFIRKMIQFNNSRVLYIV
uniref:Uncharacterized protein n=1 Tax=Populus davidiana TaxID=266767 RepID=A0A6M2FBU9_9ROSI